MKRKSTSQERSGVSGGSGNQPDEDSVNPVPVVASPPACMAAVPDGGEAQEKKCTTQKDAASDSGVDSDPESTRRFEENSLRILFTDTRDPTVVRSYFVSHPAYSASWMDNWFRREQWATHDRVLRHWKSLCEDGQQLYVPDVRDPITNEHVLLRDETPEVTSTDVWAFIEKQIQNEVAIKEEQHTAYQHKAYQMHLILRPSEFQDTRPRPLRINIIDFRNPEGICHYHVGLRGCDDSSDVAKFLLHLVEGLDEDSQALRVYSVAEPIKEGCVLLCDGKLFKKDVIPDYDSGSDSNANEPYYTDGQEASRVISSEAVWCFLRRHMNRSSNGVDEGVGKACDANMHITLVS